ncbi:MAG TPA: DeoR/GlpR family DNA-binding transcription regulator [Actinomycetota bacterium]|nr:DeoR/GlpR family DNA-binding transcription regulator [Actinomycetota bacterium]
MYAEERRQEIASRVRGDGRADVTELASRYRVTPETIRRDLTELERRGVLRRVHGGAISIDRFRAEPALAEKAGAMIREKARIAEAALAFVPQQGSALLDAGTTTLALARVFPARELSVFTNAMPVGLELAAHQALQLTVIGGRVRGRTLAHVDDWALRALSDLRVDVAFIGTNGLTVERGLSTPDPSEAAVKREMVRAAQQVVVLADRTKVGVDSTVRFAPIEDVDVLVTDRGLDPRHRAALEEAGVEVVLA